MSVVRPEQLRIDEGEQVLGQLEADAREDAGTTGGQHGPREGWLPGPGPAPEQHHILTGHTLPRCHVAHFLTSFQDSVQMSPS